MHSFPNCKERLLFFVYNNLLVYRIDCISFDFQPDVFFVEVMFFPEKKKPLL